MLMSSSSAFGDEYSVSPKDLTLSLTPNLLMIMNFFTYINEWKAEFEQLSFNVKDEDKIIAYRIVDAFARCTQLKTQGRQEWKFIIAMTILPAPIQLLVELALLIISELPNKKWPDELLQKIGRNDVYFSKHRYLSAEVVTRLVQCSANFRQWSGYHKYTMTSSNTRSDGLFDVENSSFLRFSDDDRVHEVTFASIYFHGMSRHRTVSVTYRYADC